MLGLRQHTRVLQLGSRLPGFKSTHIHTFVCADEGLCQKDHLCKQWPVPWPIPMYVPLHTFAGAVACTSWSTCDRHGLMVWQEVIAACNPYPMTSGIIH